MSTDAAPKLETCGCTWHFREDVLGNIAREHLTKCFACMYPVLAAMPINPEHERIMDQLMTKVMMWRKRTPITRRG